MTSPIPVEVRGAREELDRILRSRAFRDREMLQHLLEYLVQRTLEGAADNLKEYLIGVDVFGKPGGYDPQSDASVRVQVGKLRRKLEEYYLTEGASDPLLLQLPKRQFAIAFEQRAAAEALPREDSAPEPPPRWRFSRLELLHGAVTILLAGLALFLLLRPAGRSTVPPELSEIWKPFLAESRPVLMSLGTLQFYNYSNGMVREPEMDSQTAAEREPRLQELQSMLHSTRPLKPYLLYTGFGQATAAFLLARHFTRMNVPVDLMRSSVLGWDDIAQHNVIFLGSAKLNSQLREIPVKWAFHVNAGWILNDQPRPGDTMRYGPDYSLISLLPGLHRQGEMMVVESGSGTGVWAAAQFLTDPGYAKELAAHLRQADGQLPRHYQVVLKSQIAADVPIRISYVTHRTL